MKKRIKNIKITNNTSFLTKKAVRLIFKTQRFCDSNYAVWSVSGSENPKIRRPSLKKRTTKQREHENSSQNLILNKGKQIHTQTIHHMFHTNQSKVGKYAIYGCYDMRYLRYFQVGRVSENNQTQNPAGVVGFDSTKRTYEYTLKTTAIQFFSKNDSLPRWIHGTLVYLKFTYLGPKCPCFDWKRPSFGGKYTGHLGSRYMYHKDQPVVFMYL